MVEQGRLEHVTFEPGMFADSLLETSWAQRSRRSWTTLTSFGLEALVIGLLLLLPLWKTVGLPSVRALSTPISLGQPMPAAPAQRPRGGGSGSVNPAHFVVPIMVQPGRIPIGVHRGADDPVPQPPGGGGFEVGSPGPGLPSGILGGGGTMPVAPPAPPVPAVRTFRTSTILEGSLIRRVQPVYPPMAISVRVQGPVVLAAVISKAGTIENLRVLSGHPMLVKAALDAVSEWRYRPYILNNEPVEVETQITVNFTLGGN
jgi:protein TonB